IIGEVIDEVSYAYAGRAHKLVRGGAGRPPNGPANLLSVNVADMLTRHGVRGNWQGLSDEDENGEIGPVAELEAVALTALQVACGAEVGAMARPARISEARKMLGKVHRNAPLDGAAAAIRSPKIPENSAG